MTGNRPDAREATEGGGRWPLWKLGVLLYPFAAATVAINLFMVSLLWQAFGWPALPPVTAMLWSLALGLPAAWASARWARRLMDEGDGHRPGDR